MGRYSERYEQWGKILLRWEESGLSCAEFCRREDIPQWRFFAWKRRVREKALADRTGGEQSFVPVTFSSECAGCGIAVVLADGLRLELSCGFEENELARVVGALRSSRC